MAGRNILILYYSSTGQTHGALEIVAQVLREDGHVVEMARIRPVTDFEFPWKLTTFLRTGLKTYLGMKVSVDLQELPILRDAEAYDYIILGHQPWFLAPSVPVNSFLDGGMSAVLQGKKIISVVTCRGMWKRGYRIFERKVHARGGRVVLNFVIEDQLRQPFNMVTTLNYLLTGRDFKGAILGKIFPPFGIGSRGLQKARNFAKDLSKQLTAGAL